MTRRRAVSLLPTACACGKPWCYGKPGSLEQTTGDDGHTPLLQPIPAVATIVWCESCWPWRVVQHEVARL